MKKSVLTLLVLISMFTSCIANTNNPEIDCKDEETLIKEDYSYKQFKDTNPLKGFMNWYKGSNSQEFPSSLVYLPLYLNDLLNAENTANFTVLEQSLQNCAKNKQQAVIRIIAEEPEEDHLPQYLKDKVELIPYTYGNVTYYSPDYDDTYFKEQIFYLLNQLGKKYGDDPRIAFVQSGIYGHWGEMHIYYVEQTYKKAENKHKVSNETIVEFVQAVKKAFPNKSVGVRTPKDMPKNLTDHGYYNDMFYSDSDDKYMTELLQKADTEDRWEEEAITGEFAPPEQDGFFGSKINRN